MPSARMGAHIEPVGTIRPDQAARVQSTNGRPALAICWNATGFEARRTCDGGRGEKLGLDDSACATRATDGAVKRRVDLDDIRLLMHVVEQGSYTAAARTTGVSKSTISLRIAALE